MSSSKSPKPSSSPPRVPPIKYAAPLGTRWEKEKAAAGGAHAFDLSTDPKSIGPWIIGECVGKGASGRVKIAKHCVTGQLAAVKILPLAPLVNSRIKMTAEQKAKSEKQRLGIDREITMMKLMNHPNILRIYDVYEGTKELFLVLEYVEGGELFDFLVNRGRLPAPDAQAIFKQIILGLNYAHTFSIIHRDLKPENILIAALDPPLIKIADWGMAAFAPPTLQLETSCGSPHYASPEIVNGERYQGNATDIWSCGVILFALLTGRLPFDDKNVKALLAKVKIGKYELPTWVDPMARDLLQKMLVVESKKRITIPHILLHPWLSATFPRSGTTSAALPDPMLPPSPSTLARPISSPSLIDPAIFASLCVIWGRHIDKDGENIRKDLLSPEGEGIHAKAFYFLLGKFREEQRKERESKGGTTSDASTCDKSEGSKVLGESLTFNLGWELPVETAGIMNTPALSITPRKASVDGVGTGVSVFVIHRGGSTDPSGSNAAHTSGDADSTGEAMATSQCETTRSARAQMQRAKSHWPRYRTDDAPPSTYPVGDESRTVANPDKVFTVPNRPSVNRAVTLPCPTSNDGPPRLPPLTELRPRVVRDRASSTAAAKSCVRSKEQESANDVTPRKSLFNLSMSGDVAEVKPELKSRNRAISLAAGNKAVLLPLETLHEAKQLSYGPREPSITRTTDKENERTSLSENKSTNALLEDSNPNGVRRSLALTKKAKLRPPPLEFPFPHLSRKRSATEVTPPYQPPPLGSRNQQVPSTQIQYQSLLHSNYTSPASTSKSPLISPKFPPLSLSSVSGPGSPKTPGWLSNLFSGWKSSSEEEMKLSYFEDIQKTKAVIVRMLEEMGVNVQVVEGASAVTDCVSLRCDHRARAGCEDAVPGDEGMGHLKPVRFKVEIFSGSSVTSPQLLSPAMSPILTPSLGFPSPGAFCDAPFNAPSPVINSYFACGAGPRLRCATSPLPSPMSHSKPWTVNDIVEGNAATVIVMKHEKGSNISLKAIWKRAKDVIQGPAGNDAVPGSSTGWIPSPGWVVVDEEKV